MSPQVAVLLDTKAQRVCRTCGVPLTWYATYPEGRSPVPFDGDPAPTDITATVDGARPVGFVPAQARHRSACHTKKHRALRARGRHRA